MWKLILFLYLDDPSIALDDDPPTREIVRYVATQEECRAQMNWWVEHAPTASPHEAGDPRWRVWLESCEPVSPLVS